MVTDLNNFLAYINDIKCKKMQDDEKQLQGDAEDNDDGLAEETEEVREDDGKKTTGCDSPPANGLHEHCCKPHE